MDKWVFFQSSSFKVERVGDGIRFKVKIQPKSSRSEVVGIQSDYLKIKVSSPPTRGKANKEFIEVIASWLKVKPSQVIIEQGENTRVKRIKIQGDPEKLINHFKNLCG